MSYKCFGDKVEIAIIGASNSGKSTFIGSLFEYEICKFLHEISIHNKGKGQTKIPVHYELIKNSGDYKLKLVKVEWDEDAIKAFLKNNDTNHLAYTVAKKLCDDLGFSNCYDGNKVDAETLSETLNKLTIVDLEIAFDNVNTKEFFNFYINNKYFQEIGIIKSVLLRGAASGDVKKYMDEYSFNSIILRDTKGLLDEDFEKVSDKDNNGLDKETSEDEFSKIVVERGLIGVNACILMNGTNTIITDGIKDLYGEIFDTVVNNMPTFLVERSISLNEKFDRIIEKKEVVDESIYYENLNNDRIVRYSFKNMERILNEYGIKRESGTVSSDLVKKNFKKLLLTDIADSIEKFNINIDAAKEYENYIFTVNVVIKEVLKSLAELRETISDSLNVFSNNKEELVVGFLKAFKIHYMNNIELYKIGRYDCNIVRDKYCYNIANAVISYKNYYGRSGMLGIQGGLTYDEDRKICSIALLKSAKYIIEDILNSLISDNKIAEPLAESINNIFSDSIQARLAIRNLYLLLHDYLVNGYSEEIVRFNTGLIVHRNHLRVACESVRNDEIGTQKYYRIFEKYNNDRMDLSVVYGVLFKLLHDFINTVNDEPIGGEILNEIIIA